MDLTRMKPVVATPTIQPNQIASIQIFGNVIACDFPDWIARHASKLGLHAVSTSLHAGYLDVCASGQNELLNALALACSLGPQSAMVDHVVFKSTPCNET